MLVNWIIASIFEKRYQFLRMKGPSSSLYLSRHSIFCNFFMILIFSGFCVLQHMNSRVINWKIGLQQLPSVVNLVLKFPAFQQLYIPSTLNIDLILWHTQLIVCAENVKSWFKSWVFPLTFQAYILPHTLNCMCVSLFILHI